MLSFQYKHGDRPLEGYTIERGAGRGGFGEVYYAVSDTGREVALKVLTAYEQIELRGVAHCMNLKNPHLVTIFDVRYNDQGRPFVIMEYVAGPSLRQLLDDAPAGLGTQKAAFFLREIGKGLTFLHDHGIVHRDLKPANIFFENGYVKIGDYGLSKLIATTHTSAQTVTVGTVHYMAPEIGAGKYDRSIDIYALGAVLYEMLTGMVPFTGASPTEVLMKHLGTPPDVSNIPEPFATVIRKAMAKDPTERYQSVQEVVEAVFGAEHVRQSVSVFSPDQLSMVAAYAAQRVPVGVAVGSGGSTPPPLPPGHRAGGRGDPVHRVGERLGLVGDRLASLGDRMVDMGVRAIRPAKPAAEGVTSRTMEVNPPSVPVNDPMSRAQRAAIALITAGLAGVLGGALAPSSRQPDAAIMTVLLVFFASCGGALGIWLAVRRLVPQMHSESEAIHRIGVGGLASLFAVLLSFPFWVGGDVTHDPSELWIATFIPLFFMDAAAWAMPNREERVTFWSTIFLAGLFAFALSAIVHSGSLVPVITVAGICAVTQVMSPWDRNAIRPPKADSAPTAAWQPPGPPGTMPPPLPITAPPSDSRPSTWAERRQERLRMRKIRLQELRERYRGERRERRGSIFSFIAFLLIVPAMAAAIAVALEFPQALAAGLPDPSLTRQLNEQVFAGYPQWPALLTRLGLFAATLLTVLALASIAIGRRRKGILHILRGIVGVTLLVTASVPLEGAFLSRARVSPTTILSPQAVPALPNLVIPSPLLVPDAARLQERPVHPWVVVAAHANRNEPAAAVAAFVDAFDDPTVLISAVWFISAVVVLMWPARVPSTTSAASIVTMQPPPLPQKQGGVA